MKNCYFGEECRTYTLVGKMHEFPRSHIVIYAIVQRASVLVCEPLFHQLQFCTPIKKYICCLCEENRTCMLAAKVHEFIRPPVVMDSASLS